MAVRRLAEKCEKNRIIEHYGGANCLRLVPLMEGASLPKGAIAMAELDAGKADIINLNNRFYPYSAYKIATEAAQPQIGKKKFYAETDHPDWESTIAKTAAWYTGLSLEGDMLTGKVALLDNAQGRQVLSFLNAGLPVEISTRGYATSSEQEKTLPDGSCVNCWVINDDLWFEGIDFVMNASNPAGQVTSHHESLEDKPMDLAKLKTEHADLIAIVTAEARVGFVAEADVVIREDAAKVVGATEVTESPAFLAGIAAIAFQTTILEALKSVLPAEQAEQLAITAKVSQLESENATLRADKTALEAEKTTAAAAIVEADAKAKLVAFVAETLKDYPQADLIRVALEACATEAEVTAVFNTQKEQITKLEAQLKAAGAGTGAADIDDPTKRGGTELDEYNAVRKSMGKSPVTAIPTA